jgi:hypothetical protein
MGVNGINAIGIVASDFVIPAIGSTVTVTLDSTAWCVVGAIVIATGPANFLVTVVPSSVTVTLEFLGYPGDIAPANTILAGSIVAPAGQRGGSTLYYTSTGADLAATAFMDIIEITGATKTVTLPTAVGIAGKVYTIKLTAASTGTVACSGGQIIDAGATYALSAQYKFVTVASNGANWVIISKN